MPSQAHPAYIVRNYLALSNITYIKRTAAHTNKIVTVKRIRIKEIKKRIVKNKEYKTIK